MQCLLIFLLSDFGCYKEHGSEAKSMIEEKSENEVPNPKEKVVECVHRDNDESEGAGC